MLSKNTPRACVAVVARVIDKEASSASPTTGNALVCAASVLRYKVVDVFAATPAFTLISQIALFKTWKTLSRG